MSWWEHPSDYRWGMSAPSAFPTIGIIEPEEKPEHKDGRVVPFGFAREIPVERDPILWDGDQA